MKEENERSLFKKIVSFLTSLPGIITGITVLAAFVAGILFIIYPVEINYFRANPDMIDEGKHSTLSWEIYRADRAEIDHGIGKVDSTRGMVNVSPAETTSYRITAKNIFGFEESYTSVFVRPKKLPTINSFYAFPERITLGENIILIWNTTGAESISIDEIGNVKSNGSKSLYPEVTTSFTLKASNSVGSVTEEAQVFVIPKSITDKAIKNKDDELTEAEKIASDYIAAIDNRDIETVMKLVDIPFYFDNEILASLADVRSRFLEWWEREPEDRGYRIDSLKAKTVSELKSEGYDTNRDRVLSNLRIEDDDIVVIIIAGTEALPGQGVMVVFRKVDDNIKIAGTWG